METLYLLYSLVRQTRCSTAKKECHTDILKDINFTYFDPEKNSEGERLY